MKVGILSDSHDHLKNLEAAVALLVRNGCGLLIHLGDFARPSVLPLLARPGLRVEAVYGNCDRDREILSEVWRDHLAPLGGRLLPGPRKIELDGRRILLMHEPPTAEEEARRGTYDLVLHGHTHVARNETRGATTLCNPGAVVVRATNVAIYDTAAHAILTS